MKNIEAINWLENWLDSAGERGYQPAFISVLIRGGFTILHNTSHNSMELGKDVIAKSSDGEWYAFQLKGNPGSRFTMSQWHSHFNQLLQLCHMPFQDIAGVRSIKKFKPVLVTNGEVEEDVQAALNIFNSKLIEDHGLSEGLAIWNRGKLIEMFIDSAKSIWPHTPSAQIALLKGLVRDYRDSADMTEFQFLVDGLIGRDVVNLSKAAAYSKWVSGFIAVNIYTSSYVDHGNYFESIKLKTYFYRNVVSLNDKIKLNTKKYINLLSLIRISIISELTTFTSLLCERYETEPLINENMFGEFAIFSARRLIVQALCAIVLIEKGGETDSRVEERALQDLSYRYFTHEAVITPFLAIFWAKENFQGSRKNHIELGGLLATVLNLAKGGRLFSSYHSFEEVVSFQNRDFLSLGHHILVDEDTKNRSQFARPLLYLLAKRNWKQTCKLFWPDLTSLLNCQYILSSPEKFGSYRTDDGVNTEEFVQYPMEWDRLINIIKEEDLPIVPDAILIDIPIFLLFLLFFPFRATDDIIKYVDGVITETWY